MFNKIKLSFRFFKNSGFFKPPVFPHLVFTEYKYKLFKLSFCIKILHLIQSSLNFCKSCLMYMKFEFFFLNKGIYRYPQACRFHHPLPFSALTIPCTCHSILSGDRNCELLLSLWGLSHVP